MWNCLKVVFLIFAGLVTSSPAFSDQLIYSHQFDQGIPYTTGVAQFDDWLSYRASLPASDVTSITISGSLDSVGRTCSDPAMAQQIADAMLDGAVGLIRGTRTLSVSCDGFTWNLGSCSNATTDSNNLELNVGPDVTMCSCSTRNYTLRPGVTGGTNNTNPNWGGIAGATCAAPTQTITFTATVTTMTDTDADGVPDGDDLCPATVPNDPVDVAGCSDAQVDVDGDGVCDVDAAHGGPSMCVGIDNCSIDFNPDQEDSDGDNIGDSCDLDTETDFDGDGVSDELDSCTATLPGDPVDPDSGCSIAQLCPCYAPQGEIYPWKNHGKYASCIAHTANQFLSNGLVTETEKDAIMIAAGASACGRK